MVTNVRCAVQDNREIFWFSYFIDYWFQNPVTENLFHLILYEFSEVMSMFFDFVFFQTFYIIWFEEYVQSTPECQAPFSQRLVDT